MNLIKFNPFLPVNAQFGNAFDSFFNGGLSDLIGSDFVNEIPLANVKESDGGWKIEVAVPGFSKEDFNITIEEDRIVIEAESKAKHEDSKGEFKKREFSYTKFWRSFPLQKDIDRDQINAAYERGILSIDLPKSDIKETRKLIEVS